MLYYYVGNAKLLTLIFIRQMSLLCDLSTFREEIERLSVSRLHIFAS